MCIHTLTKNMRKGKIIILNRTIKHLFDLYLFSYMLCVYMCFCMCKATRTYNFIKLYSEYLNASNNQVFLSVLFYIRGTFTRKKTN